MTYKLYMTVELTCSYDDKEAAMDAAVKTLQDATQYYCLVDPDQIGPKPVECRVFKDSLLAGDKHAFIVDICDGAI